VADARAYLFSLEQIGIKLGLEQIHALLDALNRPDRSFPSIIVAGTNGKGSTTAMIERGLRAAGYRTGRYTSPHLVHIEERVAIDGQAIDAATFDRSAERVREAARALPFPPTFFEATTALALDVFREASVDVAVLEVGLGGRLDATNAVAAMAAVITAVDFDHEAYLGHTIEAIAAEKAGVIKPGQVVVLAGNPAAVIDVVVKTCQRQGAALVHAWAEVECETAAEGDQLVLNLSTPARRYRRLRPGLRGRHQVQNAVTAVRTLEALDANGAFRVSAEAIKTGVEAVVWPGRLERRQTSWGDILIDGAHNPAGARALAAYVQEAFPARVPLVLGVMADKDVDAIVSVLSSFASHIVATAPRSPRALTPEKLAEIVARVAPDVPVLTESDSSRALRRAAALGRPVVVAGSLYLAGEVRDLL
jgi:dihydrofolate synthase/folylpolyglutamate synthase